MTDRVPDSPSADRGNLAASSAVMLPPFIISTAAYIRSVVNISAWTSSSREVLPSLAVTVETLAQSFEAKV